MKTAFVCSSCSYSAPKWLGCCPTCKEWNSFTEQSIAKQRTSHTLSPSLTTMHSLADIEETSITRMVTGIKEWDRVVGGGIVPGSLLIVTGDPGIGKSTLLLQLSEQLAHHHTLFYFSTEESLKQVKLRAQRIRCSSNQLFFSDASDLVVIIETIKTQKPSIAVIDSIQNCYLSDNSSSASPGSINQLRESVFLLMRLAKEQSTAIIISGHITKQGIIAGPKTLEHMVDGVFYLQTEERWQTRILRSVKNRFGTTHETGFFRMNNHGLQEIPNINEYLIDDIQISPGSALTSIMEGTRPLLIELQSLCVKSKLTLPQRIISGIDHKQVVLIAAILEKYLRIPFSTYDIFCKTRGDFTLDSATTDLGIACSLLSSYFQQPLPDKSVILGEISLTGSIQPINTFASYAKEATSFGLTTFIVSKKQKTPTTLTLYAFSHVYELLSLFNIKEK
ncbi:MAG: DNA repair protein RadA [Candidatus Babeliales bacterium]